METTIQTNPVSISHSTIKAVNVGVKTVTFSDFWKNAEFNRFGIIAMLLVIVTCLGGLAAAVAVNESTWQLAMVASSAMLVEALILAVTPMRTIVIASVISVTISLLVIILNSLL